MAYNIPTTRNDFNLYDCCSYLQKSIRRGLNEDAGFAAAELFGSYHTVMWNRMMAVSCEDCSGAFTKELSKLRIEDERANKDKKGYYKDTSYTSKAIYLLTHSAKSRDGCYYAANFVIPCDYNVIPEYDLTDEQINRWARYIDGISNQLFSYEGMMGEVKDNSGEYEEDGFFGFPFLESSETDRMMTVVKEAILKNDMEASGYALNYLMNKDRRLVFKVFYGIAKLLGGQLCKEMIGLYLADDRFNGKKAKEKRDCIFISKGAVLLCYQRQGMNENLISQDCVKFDSFVDFSEIDYPDILDCDLRNGRFPDWVFDCHTIKGKAAGKNDWQMNIVEQAALNPLRLGFFDEGTWQSLYEWLKDQDKKQPGKFLSKGEYEEHLAYREGRYNNPITKDGKA